MNLFMKQHKDDARQKLLQEINSLPNISQSKGRRQLEKVK